MRCYNESSVPALSRLALDWALFDSWFASVPGPTMVNRAYAWASTSHGWANQTIDDDIQGFPQRSIFRDLLDSGMDFKSYFSDVPTTILLDDVRFNPTHMRPVRRPLPPLVATTARCNNRRRRSRSSSSLSSTPCRATCRRSPGSIRGATPLSVGRPSTH